jgi:hypothetical protein
MQQAENLLLEQLEANRIKGIILQKAQERKLVTTAPGTQPKVPPPYLLAPARRQTVPPTRMRCWQGEDTRITETLLVHEDVIPFEMKQYEGCPRLEFATYDRALDTYFSELEQQKSEMRALQAEAAAIKKLEAVRQSHEQHVQASAGVKRNGARNVALGSHATLCPDLPGDTAGGRTQGPHLGSQLVAGMLCLRR